MSYYLRTILSAYLARGITLLCKLITIPLLLRFLPQEAYAAFVILASLEGWFLLLDFGVGLSIQNSVSEALAKKESDRVFIKTALVLGLLSLAVGFILLISTLFFFSPFFLSRFIPLHSSFFLYPMTGAFFLLNTFGSLAGKILMGRQQGALVHLTQALSQIGALVFLLSYHFASKISLSVALVSFLGIPSLASLMLALIVFSKTRLSDPVQWSLLKSARSFFFFSSMAALVTLSDAFIVPRTLKAREIIEYNLLCKIFGLFSFAYGAVLQSFSPRSTEHITQKNFLQISLHAKRFISLGTLGAALFTVLVLLALNWVETALAFPLKASSISLFGCYLIIRLVSDFYATVLQSASILEPFFYLVPLQAALSIALQCLFSTYLGVDGILLALMISYLATVFWALPRQTKLLITPP